MLVYGNWCYYLDTAVSDPSDIDTLKARVQAMRDLGVLEWGDIRLGPMPQSEATATTQQPESPDDREKRARQDQRVIALAASGRLVPRFVSTIK